MCRYAFTDYKPHLACFRCRKSFKARLLKDIGAGETMKPARCPNCGGDVANMGLDFKPPPRHRIKEWEVLEQLFTIGITFHSCGCSGPGYRPRERSAFKAFLVDTIAEYERHLHAWEKDTRAQPSAIAERREAMDHWRARLLAARAALAEVAR